MDEQEKKLREKYGKLPPKKNMLSGMKERKYFDSGDYAMQKAGVSSPDSVGSLPGHGQSLKGMEGLERATPERLPHAQPPSLSSSPTNSPALTTPLGTSPTQISPTAMPTVPPLGSSTHGGLPIPGGNASQINHSPQFQSSQLPGMSASRSPNRPTGGLGSVPVGSPSGKMVGGFAGSPSPNSGRLSPSTSFGAGVAAGQGHSFSAMRDGNGRENKAGSGSGSVGLDGARVSPPASHFTASGPTPSSFPINHQLSYGGSNNNAPSSPSGLKGDNNNNAMPAGAFGIGEGRERRGSINSAGGHSPSRPSNLSLGIRRAEGMQE